MNNKAWMNSNPASWLKKIKIRGPDRESYKFRPVQLKTYHGRIHIAFTGPVHMQLRDLALPRATCQLFLLMERKVDLYVAT
jgi:hypothetical protein